MELLASHEWRGSKREHGIDKEDGTIGSSNSYGNDPNPPKDKR